MGIPKIRLEMRWTFTFGLLHVIGYYCASGNDVQQRLYSSLEADKAELTDGGETRASLERRMVAGNLTTPPEGLFEAFDSIQAPVTDIDSRQAALAACEAAYHAREETAIPIMYKFCGGDRVKWRHIAFVHPQPTGNGFGPFVRQLGHTLLSTAAQGFGYMDAASLALSGAQTRANQAARAYFLWESSSETLVVAFRGTTPPEEVYGKSFQTFAKDLMADLFAEEHRLRCDGSVLDTEQRELDHQELELRDGYYQNDIRVHIGFLRHYCAIRNEVLTLLGAFPLQPRKLIITGHSLGGAMATLCAVDIWTRGIWGNSLDAELHYKEGLGLSKVFNGLKSRFELITFGSPSVGNAEFVEYFQAQRIDQKYTRFVAASAGEGERVTKDFVTEVANVLYTHVNEESLLFSTKANPSKLHLHGVDKAYLEGLATQMHRTPEEMAEMSSPTDADAQPRAAPRSVAEYVGLQQLIDGFIAEVDDAHAI